MGRLWFQFSLEAGAVSGGDPESPHPVPSKPQLNYTYVSKQHKSCKHGFPKALRQ